MPAVTAVKQAPNNINVRALRKPAFLFFFAEWCPHCTTMKPIMEDAATVFGGVVDVFAVDIDKRADLASALKVEQVPTLIYADDGALFRYDGDRTLDAITSFACHSSHRRMAFCTRVR